MTVRDLARECRPLAPEDGLGKAVHLMRQSGCPALPVVAGNTLVGIISESDVSHLLEAAGGDAQVLRQTPVGSVMHGPVLCLPAEDPPETAAKVFAGQAIKAAPVVDEGGRYVGMLARGDVLAALCGTLTPPRIGGLATPLGVYLTSGAHRGGAGDLGLFLTGVAMTVMFLAARLAMNGVSWLVEQHTALPLFSAKMAADRGSGAGFFADMQPWVTAAMAAEMLVFFLFLRLSPLSGIHAAEHQTVHAIERGEELTPERVAAMPRVHPRCGTNLLALVFVVMSGAGVLVVQMQQLVLTTGVWGLTLGMLVTLAAASVLWRRLGALLQYLVTTKKASRRQIENGIAAGRELLARYQAHPTGPPPLWRRLLGMGIIQVAAGFVAATYVLGRLCEWLALGHFGL